MDVPPEPSAPAGRLSARARAVVLGSLALAFLAVGLHQAGRDAPTVDEGVDVSSGITALVRHDQRMVPEHPTLPKVVAALPALFADPVVPDTDAYRRGDWFDYSDDFISANEHAGRLHSVLVASRAAVLLEAVGCAALLYVLTRRWFGTDGATLAAAAWLTTPYVVGLSHFAMIDIPFVLVTLGTCVLLARWLDHPSTARTVALGAALGGALASRHTGLVLAAVVLGIMVHAHRKVPRDAVREVAIAGLVAVIGLWAVYRLVSPGGPPASVAGSFEGLIGSAGDRSVVTKVITALPFPLEWRAGFAYLDLTSTDRPSSLLGMSWDGGRWWYFPVSAALKLPVTLLVAIVVGRALALRERLHARSAERKAARTTPAVVLDAVEDARTVEADGGTEGVVVAPRGAGLVPVVVPALALWLFLVAQPLNLGLRLAMPTVALAYVGLGAIGSHLASTRIGAAPVVRRGIGAAVGLVVAVQLVASVVAVPHSLAWTPPPWRPAYRWVSDSNIDAGQSLYEVRRWARSHDRPFVAIHSTRGLAVGGGSRSLRGVDPKLVRGWVAVGVTPLMQTRQGTDPTDGGVGWLRKYCPVGTLAGGSVLLYRFDAAPDPVAPPERAAEPCFGAEASTIG